MLKHTQIATHAVELLKQGHDPEVVAYRREQQYLQYIESDRISPSPPSAPQLPLEQLFFTEYLAKDLTEWSVASFFVSNCFFL